MLLYHQVLVHGRKLFLHLRLEILQQDDVAEDPTDPAVDVPLGHRPAACIGASGARFDQQHDDVNRKGEGLPQCLNHLWHHRQRGA